MDQNLQQSFIETWQKLTADTDHTITEGEFMDSKLWTVREPISTSKRLNSLNDIIKLQYPFVLVCKSESFWKDVTDKPSDTVLPQSVTRRKKKSSNPSNHENSSICGSPLKLEVIADLSVFDDSAVNVQGMTAEQSNCGLMVKACRKTLSLFATMVTGKKESPCHIPMIVTLSDAKYIQPISCLCVQVLTDKENNFVGLKMIEVQSKPAAEPSIHRKTQINLGTSDVTCHAKYDLLTDTEEQISDGGSSISLELEWKKRPDMSLIPLNEPPLESKAWVKIQVTSGNCRSPAFGLFQEIQILKSLLQGLATSEVDWIGTQERPLVEVVQDLFQQLNLGCNTVEYRLGETNVDECSVDDMLILNERNDFDFTDHLWKVLQNCTSYSELVDVFSYMASVLKSGDLQPYIQGHNTSTIAMMVRDSYKGQFRVPTLVGLQPIRYLAEMGILKLTRDYVFHIVSKKLASIGNLSYYIKDVLDLEEKLTRLRKLHNILEVALMLKQGVNLPQSTLTDCTRQMLKHYECNGIEKNIFSFHVPSEHVSQIIRTYPPSEWRAEGCKMVDKFQESSTYLYTVEKPFDWVEYGLPGNRNSSSNVDSDETPYFLTVMKQSIQILATKKD